MSPVPTHASNVARRRAAALGIALSAAVAGASVSAGAEIETGIDPEASLPFWELRDAGISLRLVQRQPDQTRAFFMARGFSRESVERVAQRCVFQTVFRNVSAGPQAGPVEYDLRAWTVVGEEDANGEGAQGLLTREYWADQWTRLNVAKPARIAFEWALFPTQQVYHVGDYNWGMSVFDLAPGSPFALTVSWRLNGVAHSARIEGMHCAPDGENDASDDSPEEHDRPSDPQNDPGGGLEREPSGAAAKEKTP